MISLKSEKWFLEKTWKQDDKNETIGGRGAAWHRGCILASHPAAPSLILGVLKNLPRLIEGIALSIIFYRIHLVIKDNAMKKL